MFKPKNDASASMFLNLGRDMIAENTLRRVPEGWAVTLRMPFYTSFTLASITGAALCVNGTEVASEKLLLRLREQVFPLQYVSTIHEVYWHMGETAELVALETDLPVQDVNEVRVQLCVRPGFEGYLLANPDGIPYDETRQMEVQ